MFDILLSPYQLNDELTLNNRIIMAPMTRCMADDELVPTEDMAAYYERRVDTGLIITEGTIIRPDGLGYPNVPGIFNKGQIKGWQKVTKKVHTKDGKIFIQLWHVGRVSHPIYLNGNKPIAPSTVPLEDRINRAKDLEYGTPRALEMGEIPAVIDSFAQAAINAMEAGFDGVELHGANGYLIDQFLHRHTNRRNDKYGGSTENLARFALEVVDAVGNEIGHHKTGIRLSPGAYHYMKEESEDVAVFKYLLRHLEVRNIAYVHVGIFDDEMQFDYLGGTAGEFLRKNYSGTLVGCGGYTPEKAADYIKNNKFDLIAFGRPLIANPDLIEKLRNNTTLMKYDKSMLKTLY